MPDIDSILRGLRNLPLIDAKSIHSGAEKPPESDCFSGQEYGAEFWLTRESASERQRVRVVLRSSGHPDAVEKIEQDFIIALGKPNFRSEEVGYPYVKSVYWRQSRVNSAVNPHTP
jgi:hypothetical protein